MLCLLLNPHSYVLYYACFSVFNNFYSAVKRGITVNENKNDEILQELSECREDERNSQNQMLQTIATAASALTLILGASIFGNNEIIQQSYPLKLSLYLLSVIVLLTAVSYIVYLGIENVLRFHYIRHLEDSLSSITDKESNIMHWINFNSAVNTKNIKHIFTSIYTLVSYFSYFLATLFAVVFCLGLISVQYFVFKLEKKVLIIMPFVLIFISFLIFVSISVKAKDMYEFSYGFSMKKQNERLFRSRLSFISMNKKNNKIKFFIKGIIYFLYPKTKDFQKLIFVLGGYFLGVILVYEPINSLNVFFTHLKKSLLVLIIIDVLIYQARYQFNDIRGLKEDIEIMKLMNKTNKFLTLCKNKTMSVVLSLSFISIKVGLAFYLTFKFGGSMTTPLLWCIFLIILTTVLYEVARTVKCDIAIFILVACGYPLRFLTGLWCVIPNLFKLGIQSNGLNISPSQIVLYLISIAALGGFSATIPWVYEAFYQKKYANCIVKHHYVYLFKSFEERYNQYILADKKNFYPLPEKGKLSDCWNLYFLGSVIFLSFNTIMLNFQSIGFVLLEFINLLLFVKLCCSSYRIVTFTLIMSIIFIAVKIIFAILFCSTLNKYFAIGLYIHQIFFTFLYYWLRCRFDPSFDFFNLLLSLLIGSDTLKLIKEENIK